MWGGEGVEPVLFGLGNGFESGWVAGLSRFGPLTKKKR